MAADPCHLAGTRFQCDGWLPITGNVELLDDLERLKGALNLSFLRVFQGLQATMKATQRSRDTFSASAPTYITGGWDTTAADEADLEAETGDDAKNGAEADPLLSEGELRDLKQLSRNLVTVLNTYATDTGLPTLVALARRKTSLDEPVASDRVLHSTRGNGYSYPSGDQNGYSDGAKPVSSADTGGWSAWGASTTNGTAETAPGAASGSGWGANPQSASANQSGWGTSADSSTSIAKLSGDEDAHSVPVVAPVAEVSGPSVDQPAQGASGEDDGWGSYVPSTSNDAYERRMAMKTPVPLAAPIAENSPLQAGKGNASVNGTPGRPVQDNSHQAHGTPARPSRSEVSSVRSPPNRAGATSQASSLSSWGKIPPGSGWMGSNLAREASSSGQVDGWGEPVTDAQQPDNANVAWPQAPTTFTKNEIGSRDLSLLPATECRRPSGRSESARSSVKNESHRSTPPPAKAFVYQLNDAAWRPVVPKEPEQSSVAPQAEPSALLRYHQAGNQRDSQDDAAGGSGRDGWENWSPRTDTQSGEAAYRNRVNITNGYASSVQVAPTYNPQLQLQSQHSAASPSVASRLSHTNGSSHTDSLNDTIPANHVQVKPLQDVSISTSSPAAWGSVVDDRQDAATPKPTLASADDGWSSYIAPNNAESGGQDAYKRRQAMSPGGVSNHVSVGILFIKPP